MMPPLSLTPRMHACLRIIQDMTDASGGIAPSLDVIAGQLGLKSKSGAFQLVSLLVERGYVERVPNKARAIRLLHRLPPIGGSKAMAALIKALATAVPSGDGEVRVIMPKTMIDGVAAELGLTLGREAAHG